MDNFETVIGKDGEKSKASLPSIKDLKKQSGSAIATSEFAQPQTYAPAESKYGEDITPFTDLNEVRGQRQGLTEKYTNGLIRGLGTAATSFTEGTVGALVGITEALATGDSTKLYNGAFGQGLDKINESLAEAYPIYYTQEQQESILNANFIPDKLFNGAGYMAGAIGSGFTAGKAMGALTKLALANKLTPGMLIADDAAIAGKKVIDAAKTTKLANGLQQAVVGAASAHGESAAEARGARKDTYEKLVNQFQEQHGTAPNDVQLAEINRLADAAGNTDYLVNLAVTGGTNMVQFGKLMTGGYEPTKKQFWQIVRDRAGKYVVPELSTFGKAVRRAAPYTSGLVEEAGQEGVQYGTQIGTSDYYARKYDKEAWDSISEVLQSSKDALIGTINSKEGFESMLLGGILGAGGGVLHNENKAKDINTQAALKVLGEQKLDDIIKKIGTATAIKTYENDQQVALANKDIFEHKNLEYDKFKTFVTSRIETNQFENFIAELDEQKGLTEEEFKEKYGIPKEEKLAKPVPFLIEEIKTKANYVKEVKDAIDIQYPYNDPSYNMSNRQFNYMKEMLFHTTTSLNNTNKRIATLKNQITGLSTSSSPIEIFDSIRASEENGYIANYLGQVQKNIAERKAIDPSDATIVKLEEYAKDIVALEKRRNTFVEKYNSFADPEVIKADSNKTDAAIAAQGKAPVVPPVATPTTPPVESTAKKAEAKAEVKKEPSKAAEKKEEVKKEVKQPEAKKEVKAEPEVKKSANTFTTELNKSGSIKGRFKKTDKGVEFVEAFRVNGEELTPDTMNALQPNIEDISGFLNEGDEWEKDVEWDSEDVVAEEEEEEPETKEKKKAPTADWTKLIRDAVSEKELDAIDNQIAKADELTPELVDEISKKRDTFPKPKVEVEVTITDEGEKAEYSNQGQGGYTLLKTSAANTETREAEKNEDRIRWNNFVDNFEKSKKKVEDYLFEIVNKDHPLYNSLLSPENKAYIEEEIEEGREPDYGVFLVLTDKNGNYIEEDGKKLWTSPVKYTTNKSGYAVSPKHYSEVNGLEYEVGDETNENSEFRQHFDTYEAPKHKEWRDKLMSGDYSHVKPAFISPGALMYTIFEVESNWLSPLGTLFEDYNTMDGKFIIPTIATDIKDEDGNRTTAPYEEFKYTPQGTDKVVTKKLPLGALYYKKGDSYIKLKSRNLNNKEVITLKSLFGKLGNKNSKFIEIAIKYFVNFTDKGKYVLYFDENTGLIHFGDSTIKPSEVKSSKEFDKYLKGLRRQVDKNRLMKGSIIDKKYGVPTIKENGDIDTNNLISYYDFLFDDKINQPAFTINIPSIGSEVKQHENAYFGFEEDGFVEDIIKKEEVEAENKGITKLTDVTSFKTAKGSVYTVNKDGTVSRYKTALTDKNYRGSDAGRDALHKPSDVILFVKEDSNIGNWFNDYSAISSKTDKSIASSNHWKLLKNEDGVYKVVKSNNELDANSDFLVIRFEKENGLLEDKESYTQEELQEFQKQTLLKENKGRGILIPKSDNISVVPKEGYSTFDYRFDKSGKVESVHFGNKVTEINLKEEDKTAIVPESKSKEEIEKRREEEFFNYEIDDNVHIDAEEWNSYEWDFIKDTEGKIKPIIRNIKDNTKWSYISDIIDNPKTQISEEFRTTISSILNDTIKINEKYDAELDALESTEVVEEEVELVSEEDLDKWESTLTDDIIDSVSGSQDTRDSKPLLNIVSKDDKHDSTKKQIKLVDNKLVDIYSDVPISNEEKKVLKLQVETILRINKAIGDIQNKAVENLKQPDGKLKYDPTSYMQEALKSKPEAFEKYGLTKEEIDTAINLYNGDLFRLMNSISKAFVFDYSAAKLIPNFRNKENNKTSAESFKDNKLFDLFTSYDSALVEEESPFKDDSEVNKGVEEVKSVEEEDKIDEVLDEVKESVDTGKVDDDFFSNLEEEEEGTFNNRLATEGEYVKEDIKKATEWFKSKFGETASLRITKELIDDKAFGRFYKGLTYLWEQAEEGTLYHEAYHKVEEEFLTEEQVENLHKEMEKALGRTMSAKDGKEHRAEDFRNYMLTGQKSINGQPIRNTFFRRLYNYIRTLLTGKVTVEQVYKKLAGKGYAKSKKVRTSSEKLDRKYLLSMNSKEVKEIMDTLTLEAFNILLQNGITPVALLDKTPKEMVANLNVAYTKAKNSIIRKAKETYAEYQTTKNPELADKLANLQTIISKFDSEVVPRHIEVIRPLIKITLSEDEAKKLDKNTADNNEDAINPESTEEEDQEEVSENEDVRGGNEYIAANEINPITTLSNNTKMLLATLQELDSEGEPVPNSFGLPTVAKEGFKQIYVTLSTNLQGLVEQDRIWSKLESMKKDYPYVIDLMKKLGLPSNIPSMSFDKKTLWSDFQKDMNKYNSQGIKMVYNPASGDIIQVDANSENLRKRIKDAWTTNLLASDSVYEEDGRKKLNKDVLYEKDDRKFLEAIGIELEGFDSYDKEDKDFIFSNIKGIKNGIRKLDSDAFATDLFDSDDFSLRINNILDVAVKHTKRIVEASYFDAQGKSKYGVTNHNYFTLLASELVPSTNL